MWVKAFDNYTKDRLFSEPDSLAAVRVWSWVYQHKILNWSHGFEEAQGEMTQHGLSRRTKHAKADYTLWKCPINDQSTALLCSIFLAGVGSKDADLAKSYSTKEMTATKIGSESFERSVNWLPRKDWEKFYDWKPRFYNKIKKNQNLKISCKFISRTWGWLSRYFPVVQIWDLSLESQCSCKKSGIVPPSL